MLTNEKYNWISISSDACLEICLCLKFIVIAFLKFLDEHKEYRVHYFLSQMCLLKEHYAYTYISVFWISHIST